MMMIQELQPVARMTRDLRQAAGDGTLSKDEARFLVDAYYSMQEQRIRSAHQVSALEKSDEPHAVLDYLFTQSDTLEGQVKGALDRYSAGHRIGRWARSIVGIGPVIAAGLLAHVDVKVPTAGHIWRFAGLDPTSRWEKGGKRPWNASLKALCWKLGESFIKSKGHEASFYGPLYDERKVREHQRNDAGELADQAAAVLAAKRIGKNTEAFKHYSAGKLPPAHIHARARRWIVKLFLAHYHEVGYELETGEKPPMPYVLTLPDHVHRIQAPPMVE